MQSIVNHSLVDSNHLHGLRAGGGEKGKGKRGKREMEEKKGVKERKTEEKKRKGRNSSGLTLIPRRSSRYPDVKLADLDYTDDIA